MKTPPKSTEQTSEHVAELATLEVNLPAETVIGIFGNEVDPGALIRSRAGKISRVEVGDTFAGYKVSAIGEDKVVLAKGTRTKVLAMPKLTAAS